MPDVDVIREFKMAIVEFMTTQSLIGAYANIKTARVSRGLTGEVPFDRAEQEQILAAIDGMRALQQSVNPNVPIDWTQVSVLRPLIEEKIRTVQDRTDPPAPPQLFFIRTSF